MRMKLSGKKNSKSDELTKLRENFRKQSTLLGEVFNRGRKEVHGCDDRPVHAPLTRKVLKQHLQGTKRIGVYPVRQKKTPFLVVDIDADDFALGETLVSRLGKLGLPAYVERSKAKGYHVWVFFKTKVLASRARALAKALLRQCENPPKVEIFPKQDRVTREHVGNFIYLPLFGESVKEGRTVFLDLGNGGEPYPDQFRLLRKLGHATAKDLELACGELGVEEEERRPGLAVAWGEIPSKPPKRFFKLLPTDDRLRKTWEGPRDDLPDDSRSAHEYAMAALCRNLGFTKEETLAICRAMPGGRQEEGTENWRRHSIEKIFSKSGGGRVPDPVHDMTKFVGLKLPKANDLIGNGILPTNGIMVIGGQPKEGKSLLALNLAVSMATGSPFLGQFPIKKTLRVLLVQQEMTPADMQTRARYLFEHWKEPEQEQLFLVNTRNMKIDSRSGRRQLRSYITTCRPDVVILDPLYKFIHKADENSAKDMTKFFDYLDRLRGSRLAIVLVHHHRKPGPGEGGGESLRGSSVIFAYGDSYLNLVRSKGGTVKLNFNLRAAPAPTPLLLKLDPTSLTFNALSPNTTKKVPHELVQKILKERGKLDNRDLIEKLQEKTEASERTVRAAISAASKLGLIKRHKRKDGRGCTWTAP